MQRLRVELATRDTLLAAKLDQLEAKIDTVAHGQARVSWAARAGHRLSANVPHLRVRLRPHSLSLRLTREVADPLIRRQAQLQPMMMHRRLQRVAAAPSGNLRTRAERASQSGQPKQALNADGDATSLGQAARRLARARVMRLALLSSSGSGTNAR